MSELTYILNLRHPAHRTVGISVRGSVDAMGARGGEVDLQLPSWTPGSYLIREHARHVGNLRATDERGRNLVCRKVGKDRFRVTLGDAATLEVQYTLYAHELSVRTNDVTDRRAFLCGAAVFLWPIGRQSGGATVELLVPDAWQVEAGVECSTQGPGQFRFQVPDRDALVDCPILAGNFEVLRFDCLDKPHALVLDGLLGIRPPDHFASDVATLIEQAAAVFGGTLPYDRYSFLCMFTESARGGLEHLASSAILAPRTTFRPRKSYLELLGLIAHEHFHVWNVKRMRPVDLWHLDYTQENHTELLWVAEGFTAYYDDHLCRRAGLLSVEQYLTILGETIQELKHTPGRLRQSLSEASFDAWIRLYRPDENTRNSTLSYYGNGALVALRFDLRIRQATAGERSLDDVMRQLYAETFESGKGYTRADVIAAIGEAGGFDARELVESLVLQPLDPDFSEWFAPFGIEVTEGGETSPYLGVHFQPNSTVVSSVLEGTPAWTSGLMPDDEILALAGIRVTASTLPRVLENVAPNGAVPVMLSRRSRIVELTVEPAPRRLSVSLRIKRDATPEQVRLRSGWLFERA
ncbi:MAG: M61 family metallopeptidase [Planctomycetes bacterium]|nr:M61 family metallopeptidase [Planctomycetota bacterium]MCB9870568.1 M61 family metallopeptidase [Planctomycetota bacterium]